MLGSKKKMPACHAILKEKRTTWLEKKDLERKLPTLGLENVDDRFDIELDPRLVFFYPRA